MFLGYIILWFELIFEKFLRFYTENRKMRYVKIKIQFLLSFFSPSADRFGEFFSVNFFLFSFLFLLLVKSVRKF